MKLTLFASSLFLSSLFSLMTVQAQVSIISDDFSSGSIHTRTAGDFGSVGLGRSQSTGTWALRRGSLTNKGTNPRGLGYIVDVSRLAINNTYDTLNLSFDYSTDNTSDILYVHIYGYQNGGVTPSSDSLMVNLGATKGNAWTNKVDRDKPSKDGFIITNFVNGAAQGLVAPYRGDASAAHEVLGSAGFQKVEQDFSLSSIVSGAPTHLDGYDYIALVFTRRAAIASSDTVIDNLSLTVNSAKSGSYVDIPEPRTYALLAGIACFSLTVLRRR
ncbi:MULTISPECIES: hypothetical protein [unclassified Lentimonas]|uniref:hypothetical protein n=1 Tax=unclassified Lentimonas TaxID=2630993 RepID=UPI0013215C11|nr:MULTISPECIES: hypothetical protein [unclassified Lentimonas]CAA6689543.1 Unannotated [Lentimonas sp. CC19]CAA6692537.1 Unannotated [Lentimonas sp. CC10]CAA7069176.1 Unannotated [Lentimonas sp. CC11]